MKYAQVPAGHRVATIYPEFDFETYSEAGYRWDEAAQRWGSLEGIAESNRGLSAVGVYNYVAHPSFEVLCLSYNLKDGTGPHFWRPGLPAPADLLAHIWSGHLIEAWNVEFEFTVWGLYCAPKLGWPELHAAQVRCCMAKAAVHAYPRRLEAAGEVLKLTTQKDPAGKALIRKLTVPRNPTKANPALRWTRDTAPLDFARFDAYNVTDILAEAEASSRIPDLSPRELEIWQTDQAINRRGMQIDLRAVADCIEIFEQATQRYHYELATLTNGAATKSTEVAALSRWAARQGVILTSLDEDAVIAALKLPALPPAVRRMLEIRQTLAYGSAKKLYALRAQTSADGRLRGQYAFYAAHTGLWNGQGVQVANLYKGTLNKPEEVNEALSWIASRNLAAVEQRYGNALETVANCLRSLIVARRGARLMQADYSAIQAVVLAALANEQWQLDVFNTHGMIYEAMASQLTGRTLEFYVEYRKTHGRHHEDRQALGKIPTLASGFGAWIEGWKRFGADEYIGDDAAIKAVILKVRDRIPNIVEFWGGQTRNKFKHNERQELYGLEGAAISAVLDPGQCYSYRGIRYQMHKDTLYCQPPGPGDPLVYHNPELDRSDRDYARPWELSLSYEGWNTNAGKGASGWQRMGLYGGVLTQHVVANVARQFQADTLVRLERSGVYAPVMHTHDENVVEVADGQGSIEEYLAIVNERAPWAVDDSGRPWPVKAPGAEEGPRYGKWE